MPNGAIARLMKVRNHLVGGSLLDEGIPRGLVESAQVRTRVLCVAAALITALGLIFMTVCAQSDIIPDAIAAKRRPGHMMIDLEKNLVSTRFALAT